MAKRSISVTLEPATIENLKRIAAEEYRNISNMIDYIVAQYVIQHDEAAAQKRARAAAFAENVNITPYNETQLSLKKHIRIDENDIAFLTASNKI